MYHFKKLTGAWALAATGLILGGCSTPHHTDLLVFGTNTQLGISVSAEATANPGITIGFRRQELVLMPLYVNGQDSKYSSGTIDPVNPASIGAVKYTGGEGAKSDTYSVLASFGARGSGGVSSGQADVGIAQYFATGLAARTLAVAGGALVSTSKEAAEASKVTAAAAASMDPAVSALGDASKRFETEAAINRKYPTLNSTQKTAYLNALNSMFGQINGAPLADTNFQNNIQFLSEPQLAFAARELSKL